MEIEACTLLHVYHANKDFKGLFPPPNWMRENNQNDSCDVEQVEPTAVVPCSPSDMDAQKSDLEDGSVGEGKTSTCPTQKVDPTRIASAAVKCCRCCIFLRASWRRHW